MKSFIVLMIIGSQLFHRDYASGDSNIPPDEIMAVFAGRTPCQEIGKELDMNVPSDCSKLKWKFTFYKDASGKPTTYKLERTRARTEPLTGKWQITQGLPGDPQAIVYHLTPDKPTPHIFLLRGDENVLFFLDSKKQPLVGNSEFSYTLDRRLN